MATFVQNLESKYPYSNNCEVLTKQIEELIIEQDFYRKQLDSKAGEAINNLLLAKKKWFEIYGCDVALSGKKAQMVGELISDYQQKDEERIKKQNRKDILTRLLIGISIFGFSIYLLTKKTK